MIFCRNLVQRILYETSEIEQENTFPAQVRRWKEPETYFAFQSHLFYREFSAPKWRPKHHFALEKSPRKKVPATRQVDRCVFFEKHVVTPPSFSQLPRGVQVV
eukprot:g43838.t1